MEIVMRNKKGLKLFSSLYAGCQIYSRIFYFAVHHLPIFNALIQGGSRVFLKITTNNLCKPFHDALIIPFSTFSCKQETLDKKKKNFEI